MQRISSDVRRELMNYLMYRGYSEEDSKNIIDGVKVQVSNVSDLFNYIKSTY